MLKTEGQNFQNPKLKAQNRSTYQILEAKTHSSKQEYLPDFTTQNSKLKRV